MSLQTPEKLRTFQRKLYGKAKAEPGFHSWRGATRFRRAGPGASAMKRCSVRSACSSCAGFTWGHRRVPCDEAGRKAGCGKSARPV